MPVTIATRKNKLTTLNDLFSSILYNDIIERFNVRNTGLFKRIIRFIIENIGNLISANSIYKHLKPTIPEGLTTKTIYNYLDYLEEGFLLSKVSNESLIGYDEIVGLEKYYLMDHGFYKSELEEKQINIGRRLENMVFLHLLRNDYIVTVGRINSLEVDFIAKKDNKRIYIQVSYLLYDEKVIKREFEPLLKIRDNYPKYVLSMDKLDFSREGIEHVNIISFLRNFN